MRRCVIIKLQMQDWEVVIAHSKDTLGLDIVRRLYSVCIWRREYNGAVYIGETTVSEYVTRIVQIMHIMPISPITYIMHKIQKRKILTGPRSFGAFQAQNDA